MLILFLPHQQNPALVDLKEPVKDFSRPENKFKPTVDFNEQLNETDSWALTFTRV